MVAKIVRAVCSLRPAALGVLTGAALVLPIASVVVPPPNADLFSGLAAIHVPQGNGGITPDCCRRPRQP